MLDPPEGCLSMSRATPAILASALCCGACAGAPPAPLDLALPGSAQTGSTPKFAELRPQGLHWEQGGLALQGTFGLGYLEAVRLDQTGSQVQIDASQFDNTPVIGGGLQWKLFGERVDWGLEAMFSVAWRANAVAFVSNGSGAALAVNVDTLLVDFYGGPFVSAFVGDHARIYAAAGPVLQYVDYTQTDGPLESHGTGSGLGGYARAGFEFQLPGGDLLGLCVRRTDVDVGLGSALGEFNVSSTQIVLTVTTGF
jgi:hypothetical protein